MSSEYWKILWGSFRFRLGVTILGSAIIPLLLTGWLTLRISSASLTDLVVQKHQAVLDAIAGGTELFLAGQKEKLEHLAINPYVQSFDQKRVEHALQDFLADNHFFENLTVINLQQRIVGLSRRHGRHSNEDQVGKTLSELSDEPALRTRNLFGRIASEGNFETLADLRQPGQNMPEKDSPSLAISGTLPSVDNRKFLLLLPIPSFVDGTRIQGVLTAEAILDGTDIQAILNSFPAHAQDYVCFLRPNGEIIARRGAGLPPTARKFSLPDQVLKEVTAENCIKTIEVDNVHRVDLLSLVYSRLLNGFIVIGQPADEAFMLVRELRDHFLTILALALFLAIGGSVLLARSVSRPISELTAGLLQVKEGILTSRVPVSGNDDLSLAKEALNSLASSLQKKAMAGEIWEKTRSGTRKP